MFTANNNCSSYIEVILSMLPLYKVTPAISGLGVGPAGYHFFRFPKPFVIVIAVVTVVNGTVFPSFLRSRQRSILVGITAVHYQKISRIKQDKSEQKARVSVNSL